MADGVLALDIGGTNIKAGIVDRAGGIHDMQHRPSHAAEGREALLSVVREICATHCSHHTVRAIGAGTPGTVDHRTGTVLHMQTHIPDWSGTPLGGLLAEWSGLPVAVDNDVNCIALGENWKGAGRGSRCQVSLALGTGLGGGVVIDGKLLHGATGNAAELGHIIIRPGGDPCTCGNFGCAEVYTAPGAMTRKARHYLANGISSSLTAYDSFSAKEIFSEAERGDRMCRRLVNDAVQVLALLLWNLNQTFDPDIFILGGGLIQAGSTFTDPLRRELAQYYRPAGLPAGFALKVSELGDNAGILGAAKLAWDHNA